MQRHIAARLAWARRHRRWTLRDWSRIIWSDEKCFVVDKKDGRLRVYRRRNERFLPPNIHQFGPRQKSIMVWAAISESGKSQIIRFNGNITARRYRNEAPGPDLLPFINTHAHQMQYMHDNAPAHRAFATRNCLHKNNMHQVFGPWPSKSPDMNPIENL